MWPLGPRNQTNAFLALRTPVLVALEQVRGCKFKNRRCRFRCLFPSWRALFWNLKWHSQSRWIAVERRRVGVFERRFDTITERRASEGL